MILRVSSSTVLQEDFDMGAADAKEIELLEIALAFPQLPFSGVSLYS